MSEDDEKRKSELHAGPDYDVGYGKPPKNRQFPPGQSGNPKGRRSRPSSWCNFPGGLRS